MGGGAGTPTPFVTIDAQINFGATATPWPLRPEPTPIDGTPSRDRFSVIWTGQILAAPYVVSPTDTPTPTITPTPTFTGTPPNTATPTDTPTPTPTPMATFMFDVEGLQPGTDGVRVWIEVDGTFVKVFDRWANSTATPTGVELEIGQNYPIHIEYYHYVPITPAAVQPPIQSPAELRLVWSANGDTVNFTQTAVPPERLSPIPSTATPGESLRAQASGCTANDSAVYIVPAYPGRGQEILDMRAVVQPPGTTQGGIIVHDGPTINSLRFDIDPSTPDEIDGIPWGSRVLVDRRMVFVQGPSENETEDEVLDQVWYRLAPDPDADWDDPENDRWINALIQGSVGAASANGTQGFAHVVGMPLREDAENTFCNVVPTPAPTEEISFTYDRRAAAEYGMAHAYRNSIRNSELVQQVPNVVFQFYPDWVQPNGQRRVTRYLGDENLGSLYVPYQMQIRFAPFWYSGVTGVRGLTGSAVFNSELLWMGGMPMTGPIVEPEPNTEGVRYCDQPSPAGIDTWRYCPELSAEPGIIGGSSPPWDYHPDLLTYYSNRQTGTDNQPLLDRRGAMIAVFDMYSTNDVYPQPGYLNFANSPLCTVVGVAEPCDSREVGADNSGFENLDNEETAARFYQLLTTPAFVDADATTQLTTNSITGTPVTYGTSARGIPASSSRLPGMIVALRTGDYITVPDRVGIDEHGFFVAGWGPIQACPTVLSENWSLAVNPVSNTRLLYFDHNAGLNGYLARPYIVPYVIDFPGGVDRTANNIAAGALSDQLQRPKPRPFYCSGYDDPERQPSDAIQGPVNSYFDPQFNTGYWRFYTLPDIGVVISVERLYIPRDEWFWNSTRCATFADCGD